MGENKKRSYSVNWEDDDDDDDVFEDDDCVNEDQVRYSEVYMYTYKYILNMNYTQVTS